MSEENKPKKKFEFSKVIAVIGISVWLILTAFCMVMMAITLDLTPMAYVMPSIDAVIGVILGFYFWKAKAENQIKLKKIYKEQVPDSEDDMNGGFGIGF